jgi:TatD DNase family protein
MISLAKKVKKPLVIHNRNAFKETVKILEEEGARELGGVFHCFAGDPDEGRRVLELGFNLSFTGNLTFPKSHLPVIAKAIPIERILLETDCPFLSPQQYRGQRCEPAFIRYTAEKLAEIKALSIEDIARITSNNVFRIFGVGPKPPSEIVYPIRNSLYLNLTNRCSCDCVFCPRNKNPIVKGHYLKLEQEPNFEAVVKAVEAYPSNFKELVFCGYGEPTIRFELLKQLARYFRNRFPRIRLDTNGHGNLINERDITGELVGLIDAVSVSLNSADVDTYLKLNRPIFGERGYGGMLDFIKKCRNLGIETMVTIVGYPGVDTAKSQQLAKELGVKFRLRKYNDLG